MNFQQNEGFVLSEVLVTSSTTAQVEKAFSVFLFEMLCMAGTLRTT